MALGVTTLTVRADPVEIEVTAESVRGLPRPGEEGGRLDPVDTGDSTGRTVARTALWVLRAPVELVALPVRGAAMLLDRYEVLKAADPEDAGKPSRHSFSFTPDAAYETQFGFGVGLRGSVTNLLGAHDRFRLRGMAGGEYRWGTELGADSGTLLSRPVVASIDGSWVQRDDDQVFAIGNEDGSAVGYNTRIARASARVRVQLPARLAVTAMSSLVHQRIEPDDPMVFTGGTHRYAYNELAVAWDTRRQSHAWDAPGFSTGGRIAAYGGHQHTLSDTPDFARVGIDLQRYIHLTRLPRVLVLRFWAETITGDRDEVQFTDLPSLGGTQMLRGYVANRFRDRVATVAQVSYTWAADYHFWPVLFVDAGRVHAGLDDLSLDTPRVGFGGAIEARSEKSTWLRISVASSIDGGVTAYAAFNPSPDR
ncbi:MAG: BamA/TamA family outer membrane protein [Kofleriaceae bacterium]